MVTPLPRIARKPDPHRRTRTDEIAARPRPRLINLVIAALPILQHLSTVFLFLGVFNALLDDRIGAAQLGWTCFGLGGVGYCVFRFGWGVKERDAVEGELFVSFFFPCVSNDSLPQDHCSVRSGDTYLDISVPYGCPLVPSLRGYMTLRMESSKSTWTSVPVCLDS